MHPCAFLVFLSIQRFDFMDYFIRVALKRVRNDRGITGGSRSGPRGSVCLLTARQAEQKQANTSKPKKKSRAEVPETSSQEEEDPTGRSQVRGKWWRSSGTIAALPGDVSGNRLARSRGWQQVHRWAGRLMLCDGGEGGKWVLVWDRKQRQDVQWQQS